MVCQYRQARGRWWLTTCSLVVIALVSAGCATKQDVLQVGENVNQIRNDQRLLRARLDRIDSLLIGRTDLDSQIRAELRSSLDELNNQLSQLQFQLNDMQQVVYTLSQRVAEGDAGQQPVIGETPPDSTAADSPEAPATSSVDCRSLWDNAFKDMYRNQYDLAIAGFSDYLQFCPAGDLSDNSQYWIAEAYYEMKQHERAIEEYTKLLDGYPDSEKRAAAYFKIGRTYEKLGDTARALEYFLILKNDFPGSVEYDQIKDKIDQWQQDDGE